MSLIASLPAYIYSVLALAEIGVLLAAAIALLFFVVRALYRAFLGPKEKQRKLKPEDLRHLKRAGQSGFY